MSDEAPVPRSRFRRIISASVRLAFVVAVIGFAIWTFREDWPEVLRAARATPWWAILAAALFMALGVVLSLPLWIILLRAIGIALPARMAAGILLIGQLGKYLPGSIWTVAVQARLLRGHRVPLRRSLTASLLYIGVYFAMALGLSAVALLVGGNPWGIPRWICVLVAVLSIVALTPPALRLIARIVAGGSADFHLSWPRAATIVATMTASWACWVSAPLVLTPTWDPSVVVAIAAATVVGYAAGLIVVIAPAGLGVREAVVVALVAPLIGTVDALTLALLTRLAALVADFSLATLAWFAIRRQVAASPDPPIGR